MSKRPAILTGMAGGALWAVVLLLWSRGWNPVPGLDLFGLMALSLAPGGVVLLLLIGRIAQRRFFDDALIDGHPVPPTSAAGIDQSVLTNTVEQLVLATCLWPVIGLALGPGAPLALGLSFGVTRVVFWGGYHLSPPLRGFGFAAGFYPTILFLAAAAVAVTA